MRFRGLWIPKGSAIDRIMAHHGLTYWDAQYILDLLVEGGLDLDEGYDEKSMLKEAGDLINWINKHGDWPK